MSEAPDNAGTTRPIPRNVRVLGLASLFNDVASEMIFPLMPQFLITVLGGNRLHLGIIEGAANSVSSLLKLWAGAWSDRAGNRKGFVAVGYAMAAIARPLTGLATAPWHLFATRFTDRIGKGLRTAPRDALIADSTPETLRGRAYGFHRALDNLGAAAGPVLASLFLLAWPGQLRLMFLLTAIPSAAVVTLVVFGLRQPAAATPPAAGPRLSIAPFGRDFRLYLLALVLFTLGNSSDAFLLVRASEVGVPTALLPVLWCGFNLVKSAGNRAAGRAADKAGSRPLILIGWAAWALTYIGFALIESAWQLWLVFLAYGIACALIEPAEKRLVTELAGSERKGLAFGWFNFAVGAAALPSSLIFGWLYEAWGPLVAFGWGAGLAAVAAGVMLFVRDGRPAAAAAQVG